LSTLSTLATPLNYTIPILWKASRKRNVHSVHVMIGFSYAKSLFFSLLVFVVELRVYLFTIKNRLIHIISVLIGNIA